MKINVVGRVQLYEPSGSYSIIIEKAEPDGIGALAIQFEQLKKKLAEAGYFDERHKRQLPQFVKKIGVVTSPSGAVIRDIITTVSRRFPGVEILLFPTKVQGEGASQEVAANIAKANERDDLDLLIIGRGEVRLRISGRSMRKSLFKLFLNHVCQLFQVSDMKLIRLWRIMWLTVEQQHQQQPLN